MPDHCHMLVVGLTETCDLMKAIRAFKGVAATEGRGVGVRNLWQANYCDHILRSSEDFDAVAAYIFENPVRAGLASSAHEWPFSRSFAFPWKNLEAPKMRYVPPWKPPREA